MKTWRIRTWRIRLNERLSSLRDNHNKICPIVTLTSFLISQRSKVPGQTPNVEEVYFHEAKTTLEFNSSNYIGLLIVNH